MSRDINTLDPAFKIKVERLLENCDARGIKMNAYSTLRHPKQQAVLWRQSRTRAQIDRAIQMLHTNGADYLADCLQSVGPQSGKHATDALPGLSWHQWGLAIDCFWNRNGQAEWSVRKKLNGLNGYKVYAQEAAQLALNAGGNWRSKDWVHVQFNQQRSPLLARSWADIDHEMEQTWGSVIDYNN